MAVYIHAFGHTQLLSNSSPATVFIQHGMPYQRSEHGDSFCSPIYQDDIVEQVQGLLQHAAVPAPTVNLGGDEIVSMEEMLAYIESLTGLEARVTTGEEAVEAVIEAVRGDKSALTNEAADVLFHLLVMLQSRGVALSDVMSELASRQGTSGLAEKAARKKD